MFLVLSSHQAVLLEVDSGRIVYKVRSHGAKEVSVFLRALLGGQLYGQRKDGSADDAILKLLSNSSEAFSVKQNILYCFDFSSNDGKELLEEIIGGKDSELAFCAMKMLTANDISKANSFADEIIENFQREPVNKVRAAMTTKEACFRDSSSTRLSANQTDNKSDFIAFCAKHLDDFEMGKTAAISLAAMNDWDALSTLINSDSVG